MPLTEVKKELPSIECFLYGQTALNTAEVSTMKAHCGVPTEPVRVTPRTRIQPGCPVSL